ncbi:MAG: hypothetical protein IJ486_01065 [Firmicutes bacterium]|nr:hypothetical protein [Bacillota bacterium]
MSGKYDDMLYMEHPTSKKHPRMAPEMRAAQFSPFAALTGYEDAVREMARKVEKMVEENDHQGDTDFGA